MKNTIAITSVVLIPTTFATSSSSPIARTDLPNAVFFSNSSNPMNAAIETPMAKTLKPLIVAPPTCQGVLPNTSGSGRGALSNTMMVRAVSASSTPSEATSMIRRELVRRMICTYRPR